MKINTQEMRKVADFLNEMYKKGGKIDMDETQSRAEVNYCGTPACVAGWMAVYYNTKKDGSGYRCWRDGAYEFTKKLGFKYGSDLGHWADCNTYFGGTDFAQMFNYKCAWAEEGGYNHHTDDDLTLEQVSYKLHKVADRVDEYYKGVLGFFRSILTSLFKVKVN